MPNCPFEWNSSDPEQLKLSKVRGPIIDSKNSSVFHKALINFLLSNCLPWMSDTDS